MGADPIRRAFDPVKKRCYHGNSLGKRCKILADSKLFSKLNLQNGYWKVKLDLKIKLDPEKLAYFSEITSLFFQKPRR